MKTYLPLLLVLAIPAHAANWLLAADSGQNLANNGAKATIARSKGLGENDPDMMWMTTMNPETRRLIKVMPEDAARMAQVFDLLLGDDLDGRKNHIAEFGAQYLDMADIS